MSTVIECPHFCSDVRFLHRETARREDGFRLAYRLHGDGATKVLLLGSLHSTSASWRFNIQYWLSTEGTCADWQFLTIDNRGSGESGMPQGASRFTTTEMAADILQVILALGWRSLHIVGPSMGGMIATELVLMLDVSKVLVKSLALINTSDGSMLRNVPSWRLFSVVVEGVWRQATTGHSREYAAKQVGLTFSGAFLCTKASDGRPAIEALVDELIRSCSLRGPPGATQQVFAVLTHSMQAHRLRLLRHRIHCEMHTRLGVFVSELDSIIRPSCSYALRDSLKPHAFVVFERCGHNVAVEQREHFCEVLKQFWREAERSGGGNTTTECDCSNHLARRSKVKSVLLVIGFILLCAAWAILLARKQRWINLS